MKGQWYRQVEVSAAAEKLEQGRRGWTTEEDKKIKIFNLPKVKNAYFNSFESFERVYDNGFDWSIGCPYVLKIGLSFCHQPLAYICHARPYIWPLVIHICMAMHDKCRQDPWKELWKCSSMDSKWLHILIIEFIGNNWYFKFSPL